jgi:para-nitrobenzyl esterase
MAPIMPWRHQFSRIPSETFAPGVIVVTANYRVGVFGFLAHPELTAESPHHASGNYALFDQMAALRWVRDNIAGFGGNPRNVTAFGQSAGSADLGALMTSPLATGLFAKVILLSNSVLDGDPTFPNLTQSEATRIQITERAGAQLGRDRLPSWLVCKQSAEGPGGGPEQGAAAARRYDRRRLHYSRDAWQSVS